ncbi:MAG: deoxyribonuclease V [Dictyoglomaceae bacterium]|nr:deoxyribonuclease V [Dictyoglomaceae bacterium]
MDYREYFIFKDIKQAKNLQEFLARKIILEDRFDKVNLIGGVDTSYSQEDRKILGVIVVLDFITLNIVEISFDLSDEVLPYIPTFLSFREGLVIINSWKKLKNKPDILIIDGQGYAHPRNLGIASHIGVVLDIPTIGCAKKPLIGSFRDPGLNKGDWEPIYYKNKKIGIVLRTKENTKPLYVSPGHKISFETAISIILKTSIKYRFPEPIRLAHHYSKIGWSKFKEER